MNVHAKMMALVLDLTTKGAIDDTESRELLNYIFTREAYEIQINDTIPELRGLLMNLMLLINAMRSGSTPVDAQWLQDAEEDIRRAGILVRGFEAARNRE